MDIIPKPFASTAEKLKRYEKNNNLQEFFTNKTGLTNELNRFIQPRKQFLTVVVIDWNAHEVTVTDEIWLGT